MKFTADFYGQTIWFTQGELIHRASLESMDGKNSAYFYVVQSHTLKLQHE